MRLPLILASLFTFALSPVAFAEDDFDELVTVDYVDLESYLGTWYEIAAIPAIFEAGCVGTTATYDFSQTEDVSVLNTCNVGWRGGPERIAEAEAWIVDTETNAKLKVQFDGSPVAGDYWIIDLDEDYQWAAVGEPSRNYFWVLSRTPLLDEATYNGIIERAVEQGYDAERIKKAKQPIVNP